MREKEGEGGREGKRVGRREREGREGREHTQSLCICNLLALSLIHPPTHPHCSQSTNYNSYFGKTIFGGLVACLGGVFMML